MISMTRMNLCNSSSKLAFGKKSEQEKQQDNSISEKITKPIKTGLLVTSAFLAGYGTSAVTDNNNNHTEQTYQETTTSNRPPSNEMRDWYTTREAKASNGKTYIVKEHYKVTEYPFLVASRVYDKSTQKEEFRDTLYNYVVIPNSEKEFNPDGKLRLSKEYTNFSNHYHAPEKAQIKELLTDGTYNITDIDYNVNVKFSNPKQEAQQKQKELEEQKKQEKVRKMLKETDEYLDKLFENW